MPSELDRITDDLTKYMPQFSRNALAMYFNILQRYRYRTKRIVCKFSSYRYLKHNAGVAEDRKLSSNLRIQNGIRIMTRHEQMVDQRERKAAYKKGKKVRVVR